MDSFISVHTIEYIQPLVFAASLSRASRTLRLSLFRKNEGSTWARPSVNSDHIDLGNGLCPCRRDDRCRRVISEPLKKILRELNVLVVRENLSFDSPHPTAGAAP